MFSILQRPKAAIELLTPKLLDENTFYVAFIKGLSLCGGELLIESPFIASKLVHVSLKL